MRAENWNSNYSLINYKRPENDNDRILIIIGAGHLNLLNIFFDVSNEFELVSPLPYLDNARKRLTLI